MLPSLCTQRAHFSIYICRCNKPCVLAFLFLSLAFLFLSQWGLTALLRAAKCGRAEMARLLLTEFHCSLDEVYNVSVCLQRVTLSINRSEVWSGHVISKITVGSHRGVWSMMMHYLILCLFYVCWFAIQIIIMERITLNNPC